MKRYSTYEKLHQLLSSYVPEFSYSDSGDDPGSVLTNLCGEMIADSAARYEKAVMKHKIQYLNLFDTLKKEPVAAAKGYLQFEPVAGYEGDILVPAGTQAMCTSSKPGDIIFETTHDMSSTIAKPKVIVMTDRERDTIVKLDYRQGTEFRAFSLAGENCAVHKMFLCFDGMLDFLKELKLDLYIEMRSKEEQKEAMELLASDAVCWSIRNKEGKEIPFDEAESFDMGIHLTKHDYLPERSTMGEKEGYYLVLEVRKGLPQLYINQIKMACSKHDVQPEALYVNGISEPIGSVHPFGKPLGLYNEMVIESREVFSKKDAVITLEFELDYEIYEDLLEIPEADMEYRVIMKKPKKTAELRPAEVKADHVIWEYLSKTGWKRIWKEEHIAGMFDGSSKGYMKLFFSCPGDIEDYSGENAAGRLRARLLRAENVYKVPAVYKCPRIFDIKLSYSYENRQQYANYAMSWNCFDKRDITQELRSRGSMGAFYNQEHLRRTMYLGFDYPVTGTPVSIYFDLENYSDMPVDFSVEYLSDRGFTAIKTVDNTSGFLGSGNMLLMLPKDMQKSRIYGYEGYFLRFIDFNEENGEHTLPIIKGIYMNMAKAVNVNTVTEEFYLSETDESVDIQLSQENLLKAEVWAREQNGGNPQWVRFEAKEGFAETERNYQADMVQGILHFSKYVLSNTEFVSDGPQLMVKHYNYTGAQANLEAGSVDTLRGSVRYISGVSNPFPTYGGYDGYTQKNTERMVAGMLHTRNRAVTKDDFFDIISQASYGVRRVKCASGMDLFGKPKEGVVTVAILMEEYEKGVQIFFERKEEIRRSLLLTSGLLPTGRELLLSQPHFVKLNVRLWLERRNMEKAYEIQQESLSAIREFIDPLNGGIDKRGWEIGDFPRISQIAAHLRTRIPDLSIGRIVMTANVDGREVPVKEEFYETVVNPFVMAVNGEHIVYIDIK